jgi:hypothetical protein
MMGVVVALAFVAFVATHVVLVVALARRAWWKGALEFFVAPLAPWWAWGAGMRVRTWAWGAALAAYAIAVAVAAR